MRQATLAPSDLPQIEAAPRRRIGPVGLDAARPEQAVHAPIRLGESLWRGVRLFLAAAAGVFAAALAAHFGVEELQAMRGRAPAARIAALRHLALNRLRGDVQSVADLGEGRYELTTYLQNVGSEPIYVMAPEMRAYVQVASMWQELPLTARDDSASGVTRIEG